MSYKDPHIKIPCVITDVKGTHVWARVFLNVGEFEIEFNWAKAQRAGFTNKPVPPPGQMFTLHQTKRGHKYIYVIDKPVWTKKQLKKVRIRAREIQQAIDWNPEPTAG